MIPLRDLVVFPQMIVPFFVGRERSVRAVEEANSRGKVVFLTTQKSDLADEPSEDDIYRIGTVARILQMLKLPDGSIRVLVEGTERAGLIRLMESKSIYKAKVQPIRDSNRVDSRIAALMRTAQKEFARFAGLYKKVPEDVVANVERADSPDRLVDTICSHIPLKMQQKVELLSITDPASRLETLVSVLIGETEILGLEKTINSKVRKRVEKSQKKYFLNEQLKEIKRELGEDKDDPTGAKELEQQLKSKGMPEEVLAKCLKEVDRLARLQPISPESGLLRTYLEWICDLPWKETSEDNRDIGKAQSILDSDHYGLKKVKERILDFIAVRQLKDKVKGPILCFVGPPGTGKTSLGRSVARALGREFVRVSLGGVRDEAEIRGHRKTYIGALPGKIIQSMRKAKTRNPVFLLDEIDKMSSDFRGDPAAAMLEVLDPEQNSSFVDHYLEVQYDLSDVMFITTANSIHNIPYALRDRMEIIELSGYTEFEKEKIASQFLIPKQLDENGLSWADINFQKPALLKLIRNYTMESGVRNLEREIANVLRKIARRAVKKGFREGKVAEKPFRVTVTPRSLEKFLGKLKYQENSMPREPAVGLAYGLAWTELGGKLLPVEVSLNRGKGELHLTGNLGDVMKESAQTALSFLKSRADLFGIKRDFYSDTDIHVHVPEGAIPKDGPSAGITIAAALLSAVSGYTVTAGCVMTGEITLTGRLLQIGGVKEKVLAAHRNGMTHVLMPELNRKDINELPTEVLSSVGFIFAETISDALFALFPPELEQRSSSKPGAGSRKSNSRGKTGSS
jgi:ATP-dependent Lon protease